MTQRTQILVLEVDWEDETGYCPNLWEWPMSSHLTKALGYMSQEWNGKIVKVKIIGGAEVDGSVIKWR